VAQEIAALRDFDPAYDRSVASDWYGAGGRGMSASRRKRTKRRAWR